MSTLLRMNKEVCRFYKPLPHSFYCEHFTGNRKNKNEKNRCYSYCNCKDRQDVLDGKAKF